jgi:hypothetical protein
MGKQEVIIEYKGHLTFNTTGRMLTILKCKMVNDGIHVSVYKRILSVVIEALENIYKYNDQYQDFRYIAENYVPYFKISRNETAYYIICQNPIKNEHIPDLQKKLETVNSKDFEGLRLLYRETISNGKFSHKGGAGLGIIEMAKISGNPLLFTFEQINESFSWYSLTIKFD